MDGKRKVLVIDTSAFISGFDPSAVNEEAYSVSRVGDELLEGSIMKMRFNASIESGRLKLINPSVKCIDIAKEASREVGDIGSLSEADIEVLALAVQLKDRGYEAVVLTDDYSMQNVAEKLELNFTPLANLGIRYHLSWIYYCPACGRKYPPDQKITLCENCGMQLKRKPVKKLPVRKRGVSSPALEEREETKKPNAPGGR
ncbi:hypothetical protein KEJ43_03820 [Candidatus Bathyarchaeota archaeon]|nr:hypothetical protein [Candidatus Bathyarchaeota archaeon]